MIGWRLPVTVRFWTSATWMTARLEDWVSLSAVVLLVMTMLCLTLALSPRMASPPIPSKLPLFEVAAPTWMRLPVIVSPSMTAVSTTSSCGQKATNQLVIVWPQP